MTKPIERTLATGETVLRMFDEAESPWEWNANVENKIVESGFYQHWKKGNTYQFHFAFIDEGRMWARYRNVESRKLYERPFEQFAYQRVELDGQMVPRFRHLGPSEYLFRERTDG